MGTHEAILASPNPNPNPDPDPDPNPNPNQAILASPLPPEANPNS